MNRGSLRPTPTMARFSRSFNEAPIHESGKSEHRRGVDSRTSPFNEAPIHESGK